MQRNDLLRRLRVLNLGNNSFGGLIPANISSCSSLIQIDVSYNVLVENIPLELGSLSNLQTFTFRNNNLSGIIPNSFGNFQEILGHFNNLRGSIPEAFGRLKHLCH